MHEPPLVSVIIPTACCGPDIDRAIASIQRQDYPNLEIVVAGDACTGAAERRLHALPRERSGAVTVRVINAPSPPGDTATYRPARAAHARTVGTAVGRGGLLAFLDDDNEYEPEHLSDLADTLEHRPELLGAYCWRQLLDTSGAPYRRYASPWEIDPVQARRDYNTLVAAGVWVEGTNLLRDRLDHNTVDSSCWMLRPELLMRVPFRLSYTPAEREVRLGEDVAFCMDLRRRRVPVGCVPMHSVRYHLGGFSTSGPRNYLPSPSDEQDERPGIRPSHYP